MLFKTHVAFGIFVGLLAMQAFDFSPLVFLLCVFASILPDIDSTKSFIGNRFYLRPLQWMVKHRGFFHSLTACVLFSIIVWAFVPKMAFAFFAGYAVHLLIDSFTIEGVTPFWPLTYKTEGAFTTGNVSESIIFFVMCIVNVLLFISFIIRQ
jgi:membrane-bound metal-dependent hydrolase YbcI (DUF457 family)